MSIKKLKIIFILLIIFLIWLTVFNLLNDLSYVNQDDKSLIWLPEKSIALFMSHRPFSRDYTVYYLDGINIYGSEQSMRPDISDAAMFYSSNYHNDLNVYVWIFELLLLIIIIILSKYIKKTNKIKNKDINNYNEK